LQFSAPAGALAQKARAAPSEIVSAIRLASQRTGVNFAYLMEKAAAESGFRPDAKASTSSATGLFQFLDGTWLDMLREHGAKHGLAGAAGRLEAGKLGEGERQRLLDLRLDPKLSAVMAGEYARDNQAQLSRRLGQQTNDTQLYLAHFLGAAGAERFLGAMRQQPERPAAELLPEAARANRSIFFDGARARSLAEVYQRFDARFGQTPSSLAHAKPDDALRPSVGLEQGVRVVRGAPSQHLAQIRAQLINLDTQLALAKLHVPEPAATRVRQVAAKD